MKTISALLLVSAAALTTPLICAAPATQLLGNPSSAAGAVPTPEVTILNAVSDDGHWLLLTSSSDRWVTNDLNAALDVLLVDLTTGTVSLVSSNLAGRSARGTSLGGNLSADANRIALQTRAPDLGGQDANLTWDVFVHDVALRTNLFVSLAVDGQPSTNSAMDPCVSDDGRYVLFRSAARDLAINAFLCTDNLYRRDLLNDRTECVTTNLPTTAEGLWSMTSFAATPDVQAVAVCAKSASTSANSVAWFDLATGQAQDCAGALPPALIGTKPAQHGLPALSADRRFVAFRSDLTVASTQMVHGLSLYDTSSKTLSLLSLRTNNPSLQVFPSTTYQAHLSAEGHYLVYAAPWPCDVNEPIGPARTNGPPQVYLYDRQNETTRLISVAADGITPADAGANEPWIAPDGRGVMFLSSAGNLAAGATTAVERVYWWDRATGTIHVAGEPGGDLVDGRAVLSLGGQWIASLSPDAEGNGTITLFNTGDFSSRTIPLTPCVQESASGRGWLDVRPEGVSADGRYVALRAFPTSPIGSTNHLQAYRIDTLTGSRELLTDGIDGQLASSPPLLPSISADGSRVLYVSAASNLSTNDLYVGRDVYLLEATDLSRRYLRPPGLLSGYEHTEFPGLLSPDGRFAVLAYLGGGRMQLRLADLQAGTYSGNLRSDLSSSSWLLSTPSFSRDGGRIALGLGSATMSTVDVYDPSTWMTNVVGSVPFLWRSAANARDPILSADGSRVAYTLRRASPVSYAILVTDWAQQRDLFNRNFGTRVPSAPKLSADGASVVWEVATLATGYSQVWCGDVASGNAWVMSVAPDGVTEGNGHSKSAAISADGRFVAFASLADNLVPDDTNRARDVFLRDRATGRTLMVSRNVVGDAGGGWSMQAFFSADGRHLFFLSHAPDLASGDYNQTVDLFKVEIAAVADLLLVVRRNVTAGETQLLWSGTTGRQYAIEFKDELGAADWTRLPGVFDGSAPVAVEPGPGGQRFFRLVEVP
jgi:Tol biopolymer transport system component